jgi:hypothetical protein
MRAMVAALFAITVLAPSVSSAQSKKDWRERAERSEREHAELLERLRAIELTPDDLEALRSSRERADELEAKLEREREARLDAEAKEAEAREIAKEALRRNDKRELSDERPTSGYAMTMSGALGSPTQVIPTSEAVMYVDRLPPGVHEQDTLRVRCNGSGSCRGWILVILGNELPSVPMDGQHPFPQRVRIGDVEASFHLLPPGSTGYIVPDKSSYSVIRLVRFEGSPTLASGLWMKGVATITGNRANDPRGKFITDAGVSDSGGAIEAVQALLLRISSL